MNLTTKQEQAIAYAWASLSEDRPLYIIGGYAGTGKTTIIKTIAERADEEMGMLPMICAFTGKAVARLREKGIPTAQTIHRTIFNYDADTESFVPKTRDKLDGDYFLVDEASMISTGLWEALKTYRLPIILVGDPGQLEPIGNDPKLMHSPDIVLDEIHRQAEGSGIIQLADDVRKEVPTFGDYGPEVQVWRHSYPSIADLLWADVVIVYYNATRHRFNRLVRKYKKSSYFAAFLDKGEQIIVLQNNMEHGVFNGQGLTVTERVFEEKPRSIHCNDGIEDFEIPITPWAFGKQLKNGEKMPWFQDYVVCDYGYALTCHKSQGSEWDKVVVYDEGGRGDVKRWQYTAITRAAKELRYFFA